MINLSRNCSRVSLTGRNTGQHARRFAFTLIEVRVVVAIIALLISILLPSLKSARESARATVCGHQQKQLAQAGTIWMTEGNKNMVPAPTADGQRTSLRVMKGQAEMFKCPSTEKLVPIAPVLIRQYRTGFTYPALATDSPYFRRNPAPNGQGFYEPTWKRRRWNRQAVERAMRILTTRMSTPSRWPTKKTPRFTPRRRARGAR